MNRNELKILFDKLGVPEDYYNLEGNGLVYDSYVIEKNYHRWIVFYLERGKRNEEVGFSNEHEACLHMKNLVTNAFEFHKTYHAKQ